MRIRRCSSRTPCLPAKVISVAADPDERTAEVIVPDYQLSLAIGKEGQNARLAAETDRI